MATSTKKPMSNTNYGALMLVLTLVVIGVAGLVGKTLAETVVTDTKVVLAKNKANDQLKKNLEVAPRLIDNYNALGESKTLIANALPNTADLPGLIGVLENMSSSVGVTLKSVTPSSSVGTSVDVSVTATDAEATTPKAYNVSLAFDANYAALQKLLDGIERSARPMRVTAIQLTGSGASLSVQMELSTFFQDKATIPFKMEVVK
jgi:hypothetical protein